MLQWSNEYCYQREGVLRFGLKGARGATQMARGGIRLVHGLAGMKIDRKYAFLHAFFLICLPCSFPKFVYMTKNTPFFPILHVFAPLNDVRAYSAWSWKTTLITWIFGRAWYPLDIRVPPPPGRGWGCSLASQSQPIFEEILAEKGTH